MSTTEVVELTGLTRSKLLVYAKTGIVSPLRASASEQSELRWTFEQAWMVSVVPDLMAAGMSLEDIAVLANAGTKAVLSKLEEQYASQLRTSRRGRKSVVHRMRELSDTFSVDCEDADYVRYIPQRYLALAPIPDAQGPAVGSEHNQYVVSLMNIASSLGWCCTSSFGYLSSIAADGLASSFYAFNLLASPPMPSFTGTKAVDGGCYRIACRRNEAWPCDGKSCELCTRRGREPSQANLFDWNGAANHKPRLWDATVMTSDLDGPYDTGIWSEYTQQHFGGMPGEDGPRTKSATVRPRKMPQEFKFPLGVNVCVLPAGIYLCRQCTEDQRDKAFARLLGQAAFMEQRTFTQEDELRASERVTRELSSREDFETGPVPDPFALARIEGNPNMAAWWQKLTNADARKLVVPTNMALAPEDGYIITCAALPVADRNDLPRYEIQLLVDASKLTTPPQAV